MGITTKRGDKGITYLYDNSSVSKDDIRIEVCGTLDELCSFLGLCKNIIKNKSIRALIESLQNDLFVVGAEVASGPKTVGKLKDRIDSRSVHYLDKKIKLLEKKKKLKSKIFAIPGKNAASSLLDISRAVARRLERRTVTLNKKRMINNPYILVYLNRLSDLLFLLAHS